jgi:hypothetical protein
LLCREISTLVLAASKVLEMFRTRSIGSEVEFHHFCPPIVGVFIGLACSAIGLATSASAEDLAAFDPALPVGTHCLVELASLRPTQCAVGYREVDQRGAKIAEKSPKKLKSYITAHLPLVVVGPSGAPYLIDGHHLCFALLKYRIADRVEARIVANWRESNAEEFWKSMRQHGWVYPYDNKGQGPIDPQKLPQKIREMTDDPYRSLAWAVRKRAGYVKTLDSFAEFQWANFLRTRVAITEGSSGFEQAVEDSLKIVHGPEAKKLPGYEGADHR